MCILQSLWLWCKHRPTGTLRSQSIFKCLLWCALFVFISERFFAIFAMYAFASERREKSLKSSLARSKLLPKLKLAACSYYSLCSTLFPLSFFCLIIQKILMGNFSTWGVRVWPDIEIKSSPKFSRSCQKVALAVLTEILLFFQNSPNCCHHLGYFCKKLCHQKLSEIAQSGHTGGDDDVGKDWNLGFF